MRCCPPWAGRRRLNCALDLAKNGVLEKYGVELIGASREAIDKAEDREKFKQAMTRIGLGSARSAIAHSLEEALQVQAMVAIPPLSGRRLPWEAAEAGLPTTVKNFSIFASAGWKLRPPGNC